MPQLRSNTFHKSAMLFGRSVLTIAAACLLDGAAAFKSTALLKAALQGTTPGGAQPSGGHRQTLLDSAKNYLDVAPRCVLVLPDQKLATCAVAKVASSTLKDMFNKLNGFQTSVQRRGSCSRQMGVIETRMTKEDGWTFATFTRDPLERYLSAWGSKCLPAEDGEIEGGGLECGGEVLLNNSDEEAMIQAFERRVQLDKERGLSIVKNHFRKQADILRDCGWDKFNPAAADFVASLSGGELTGTILQALASVLVPDSASVVDEFFPGASKIRHHPITHSKFQSYYRKAETVQAVYELYKDDYELLNFTRPDVPQT